MYPQGWLRRWITLIHLFLLFTFVGTSVLNPCFTSVLPANVEPVFLLCIDRNSGEFFHVQVRSTQYGLPYVVHDEYGKYSSDIRIFSTFSTFLAMASTTTSRWRPRPRVRVQQRLVLVIHRIETAIRVLEILVSTGRNSAGFLQLLLLLLLV
jgi:hypothetical protein